MDCAATPICLELVKGLPTAIVALLVGGIAALIAYRQYRVARAKLNLDLFERRLAVYDEIHNILNIGAKRIESDSTARIVLLGRCTFLFGPDIRFFVNHAVDQRSKYDKAMTDSFTHSDYQADKLDRDLQEWLIVAELELAEKFAPYMNFSNWN